MSELKNYRCIVDLKSQSLHLGRIIKHCTRAIIIVQGKTPGQAETKIYVMFEGAVNVPYLVGTPREMTGTEQLQLFTT